MSPAPPPPLYPAVTCLRTRPTAKSLPLASLQDSPTASVHVALLPDTDASLPSHLLVERLPRDLEWHQAELSFDAAARAALDSRKRLEASRNSGSSPAEDGGSSHHKEWCWAWCLWNIDIPIPVDASGDKWAVVARSVTAAGVEQEKVSAWNLRGFCERGWPVVRGVQIQTA